MARRSLSDESSEMGPFGKLLRRRGYTKIFDGGNCVACKVRLGLGDGDGTIFDICPNTSKRTIIREACNVEVQHIGVEGNERGKVAWSSVRWRARLDGPSDGERLCPSFKPHWRIEILPNGSDPSSLSGRQSPHPKWHPRHPTRHPRLLATSEASPSSLTPSKGKVKTLPLASTALRGSVALGRARKVSLDDIAGTS